MVREIYFIGLLEKHQERFMKFLFLSCLMIPFSINAYKNSCRSDPFYYKTCMQQYQEYYINKSGEFKDIDENSIDNDRDMKIFYSGCAYSLEIILNMDD